MKITLCLETQTMETALCLKPQTMVSWKSRFGWNPKNRQHGEHALPGNPKNIQHGDRGLAGIQKIDSMENTLWLETQTIGAIEIALCLKPKPWTP
jgi:hypothetical protein